MANLYELAAEFAGLQEALQSETLTDEEITALLDTLDESRLDLRTKVDNICRLLANIKSDAKAYKEEEARLGARRKTAENKVESLRDWMRSTMELLNVPEIKTGTHTVSIQKGQPVIVVTDETKLPAAYIKVTTAPNKTAIMKRFKDHGEILEGTDVVPGKTKLVIR